MWCPCGAKIGRVVQLEAGPLYRRLYLLLRARELWEIDGVHRFASTGVGCFIVTKPNGELVIEEDPPEYTCGKCKQLYSLGSRAPLLLQLVGRAITEEKRMDFAMRDANNQPG